MSDIEELQGRIAGAMDRIARGLDGLGPLRTDPDPDLVRALEEERTANAQLTERVRALKDRADADGAQMRAASEAAEARMAQLDTELQRVRRANEELLAACAALREANAEGVGDADLVNRAALAELEGLRATRAADMAEAGAILAALQPLLENGAAAPEQGDA